ncbi:MAG: HyaD/HybD family hydrogenase maturation endopeptidase [Gammaproteobacteria bacterium]|nr:HyaD/HybD family hydrogenase maturation endopeptidase [Gammaproteobacteria bacterium]
MSSAFSPHAQESSWDTLILGIGNVLYADEGFGVRCVENLHVRHVFPESVNVMDGGTQGIFLLPWVRSASRLLIFDAIDFGLEPTTLKLIVGDNVPRYMGAKKVSMHQAGFQEVLSSAALSGEFPSDLALIGVQPELLNDYGGSLTPGVKAQIKPALRLACEVLIGWGIEIRERPEPLAESDHIGPNALDMGDYERGRPILSGR